MTDQQRRISIVATILAIGVVAGCTQEADTSPTGGATEAPATSAPMPDHFVADTGAEGVPPVELIADWNVNVNDPQVLRDLSIAVVSGRVIGVEGSHVDEGGFIVTNYSVQVGTVYKGEDVSKVVTVSVPGGSVPLEEYTESVDELGLSELKLGPKELQGRYEGPRVENWGLNPTSAALLAELQPDFWVFYLEGRDDGVYVGTGFDHSMSYLKDGQVHSLHSETERPVFPEAELFEK